MNYEKKYKEALERARYYHSQNYMLINSAIEDIFPELKEKESKDDRTRKAILTGLIDCRDAPDLGWSDFGGINIDECIAWLEKLGEKFTAIDVDKMVMEYSHTKDGDFGLPVNCMTRAYRKGINDALKLL